ncbi:MAG: YbaB/EbfC family nucleoid-associated protein [Patescibacteria group bacterium]|nr:YbaB/EbfC family nucleoid-associated protein [Patescibacteria group bacterium]
MFNKLKQVKDMRDKAKKLQNMLSEESVEASAAWGKVKVVMDGNQSVQSVEIDPEMLSDKRKLEEAMKEVYNDAVKKAQKKMVDKMRKSGDLNIPGLT